MVNGWLTTVSYRSEKEFKIDIPNEVNYTVFFPFSCSWDINMDWPPQTCSRHYPTWRTSWNMACWSDGKNQKDASHLKHFLKGHQSQKDVVLKWHLYLEWICFNCGSITLWHDKSSLFCFFYHLPYFYCDYFIYYDPFVTSIKTQAFLPWCHRPQTKYY